MLLYVDKIIIWEKTKNKSFLIHRNYNTKREQESSRKSRKMKKNEKKCIFTLDNDIKIVYIIQRTQRETGRTLTKEYKMTRAEIIKQYSLDIENELNDTNFNGLYDILRDYELATDGELELACNLCGQSVETLLSVLYCRAGLRSIEQLVIELAE